MTKLTANYIFKVERISGCMSSNGQINWTGVAIWNGSFRALWSFALSLLVLLCDLHYGFIIDWFLSSKPFILISKLSFGMYLTHINLYAIWSSSLKHVILSDLYELFWLFMCFLTLTATVAAFFHLLVEAPCTTAWNLLLIKIKSLRTPEKVHSDMKLESHMPVKSDI